MSLRFAILGDGPWGTALARRMAGNGVQVRLVGLTSPKKRPPNGVVHTTHLAEALAEHEAVLIAVSVDSLPALLKSAAPHFEGHHRVATTARGLLAEDVPLRASEILQRDTCVRQTAVLAGAADAAALEAGHPAALVVGSAFPAWSKEIQGALAGPALRVYTNEDPAGVELANALAAVMAVAMGAARALNVGGSSEATALTRALAEMERLVQKLGGQPGTAYGLAGLGVLSDLVFQADGEAFTTGLAIGRGEVPAADGELARAAALLSQRARTAGVRSPMVDAIAGLFAGTLSARDALSGLMSRAARAE